MIGISIAVPKSVVQRDACAPRRLFDESIKGYPRRNGPFVQGFDELAQCVVWTQWITTQDLLFKRFDDVCT